VEIFTNTINSLVGAYINVVSKCSDTGTSLHYLLALFSNSVIFSLMKLTIIGDGVFGTFLKELLKDKFELQCFGGDELTAESVILAVPISAYKQIAAQLYDKHLINVCSVQSPSTEILLHEAERVTSIHPLFGPRTAADKRNSIGRKYNPYDISKILLGKNLC
jgi:hypothetical protein